MQEWMKEKERKGKKADSKCEFFSVRLWGPQAKCVCCLQLHLSAPSMFKVSLL